MKNLITIPNSEDTFMCVFVNYKQAVHSKGLTHTYHIQYFQMHIN